MANHTLTVPLGTGHNSNGGNYSVDREVVDRPDREAVRASFDVAASAGDTLTLVFDIEPWSAWLPEPRRRTLLVAAFGDEPFLPENYVNLSNYLNAPVRPGFYRAGVRADYLMHTRSAGAIDAVGATGGTWTPGGAAWDYRGDWAGALTVGENGVFTCVRAISTTLHVAAIFETRVDAHAIATWRRRAA